MSPWIFLSVSFVIIGSAYFYVGWRIIIPASFNTPWNWIAWSVIIVSLLILYIPFVLTVLGYNNPLIDALAWAGYISLGFFSLVIALLIFKDLILLIVLIFNKISPLISDVFNIKSVNKNIADPERRRFLINSFNYGILGVSALATGYGMYEALRKPFVKKVDIPIQNLPNELEGFTIAQFSDIHAGPTVKRDYLQMIVDEINSLKADFIAFTGDLVDGSVEYLKKDVEPCRNLDAPFGKYFVTGNHEYYSGVNSWVKEAKNLGFDVLLNEHRILHKGNCKIIVAGVTDTSGGQFLSSHKSDPKKALDNAPLADVKILLAHQPRSLYEAADAGFDIQLSGHTHGGQYIPWNLLATVGQPFIKGLNKFKDTWIYVSQGTGYWGPPLRIGAKSEITLIRLIKEVNN